MHRPFIGYLLLALGLYHTTDARKPPSKSAVLLSSIKSLTLRNDQLTSARRTSAIPQLSCVGGSGKGYYDVDVMRCTNSGAEYDEQDIQWTCQASLPAEFKLGSTEVICEGYDSPEDPYVLKGSCGVEYRLVLTEAGEEKYGQGWRDSDTGRESAGRTGLGEKLFTFVFWAIFIGIVGLILYSTFFGTGDNANPGPRRLGNGGWGGGGDDNDDPPPPYTPQAPFAPKHASSQPSSARPGGEAWRPGFWSGAAAGAAATYAMNRNRATENVQAGPSNWFGRGEQVSAPMPRSGSGSSSPPSSSRYESTGFGGTRRR